MSTKSKQIILIALSVLLVVLFLFMPEQPLEVRNNQAPSATEKPNTPVSEKTSPMAMSARVEEAIRIVQGENPMAGIQELLSIVKQDSTQIDALYYLGLFSIQTAQFEKAVNRFEKVITFAGLKKYPDTRYHLAIGLEELGKKADAISQLESYLAEIKPDETDKREAVLKEINRLRN